MSKSKVVSFPHGTPLTGEAPAKPARLKAERVQELADEIVRAQLKAERVQEPVAVAATVPGGFVVELSTQPPQAMAVEIYESKVTITLLGNPAAEGTGTAG